MWQSELALEKYWVTQRGYLRLETTMALGMGITDGKFLLCHDISEGKVEKKFQRESTTTVRFMTD